MSSDTPSVPNRTVRCPFCLQPHTMPADCAPSSSRSCENCKRTFSANKALPYKKPVDGKRGSASTLPRLLKQLALVLGGVGLVAAGAWFAWGAWSERQRAEEPSDRRTSDPTAAAMASETAPVHVIVYGGTLRATERGPVLVPFTGPSLATKGDRACDAKEKSPLTWELERAEGEQGLRIPVSLVVNGERVTEMPKGFTEGRLTTCRLPVDEGVRAIHLRIGETRIFTAQRPVEPIYFVETTATPLPARRLALAWRTRPTDTSAALTQTLPDRTQALVVNGLTSPTELALDELPALPKDVALGLIATDGFTTVTAPLAVRVAKPESAPTAPPDKTALATVTGTWTVEGKTASPPPPERVCAVPQDAIGKRLCAEVVAGKTYTLDLVPARYRVCLAGSCDLCVLDLTPTRGATRDFERVGTVFTFDAPAEGACAPPETTVGDHSPRLEATYERTTRDANTRLAGVKLVTTPPAEVTRGTQVVAERLELAPGRHRFRISKPELDIAELLWIDLHGGEEVEVRIDLLRTTAER